MMQRWQRRAIAPCNGFSDSNLLAGLSSLREKVEDIPRGKIKFSHSDSDAKNGLTKTDLCERININGSQINQWATMLNLDPDEYLFELTGWKKPLNARRYFPVLGDEQKWAAKTSQ